jgi:hypothetical protein
MFESFQLNAQTGTAKDAEDVAPEASFMLQFNHDHAFGLYILGVGNIPVGKGGLSVTPYCIYRTNPAYAQRGALHFGPLTEVGAGIGIAAKVIIPSPSASTARGMACPGR